MSRRQHPISKLKWPKNNTFRRRRTVFNTVRSLRHLASSKWPQKFNTWINQWKQTISNNLNFIKKLNFIKRQGQANGQHIPDLGRAQNICGGVKLVLLDPNPVHVFVHKGVCTVRTYLAPKNTIPYFKTRFVASWWIDM